jgi:hypothetical protein
LIRHGLSPSFPVLHVRPAITLCRFREHRHEKIGNVGCAEFAHDVRAVKFRCSGTQTEGARGFLAEAPLTISASTIRSRGVRKLLSGKFLFRRCFATEFLSRNSMASRENAFEVAKGVRSG